jgi:hypothetical protein
LRYTSGPRTPHDVETAIARVCRDREEAQRVDLAAWPETRDLELLVARFAHSHSASQFLQHLPSHWNSDILPPHCGQTKLMMDEMMCPWKSPGSVSVMLIIGLLSSAPKVSGRHGPNNGYPSRVSAPEASAPNWLAAESVWVPHACRFVQSDESANSLPIPTATQGCRQGCLGARAIPTANLAAKHWSVV